MRLSLLAPLALLFTACTQSGTVQVQLTDAPADIANLKSVLITVGEVRVHNDADTSSAGAGNAGAGSDGSTGSGWIVLCTGSWTYDLMTLRNGVTTPLCNGAKTETVVGNISQIRLGVTDAHLIMQNGQDVPLAVPSGAQSGLKIDVNRQVQNNQTLSLTLDFVADQSIVDHGNGTYSLKPVLRLAN